MLNGSIPHELGDAPSLIYVYDAQCSPWSLLHLILYCLRSLNQNQLRGEIPPSLYMNHPPTAFRYVCAILMTLAEISSYYNVWFN